MRSNTENRANICFDCKKACGGCSWSKNFTPVKGWLANKTKIRTYKDNIEERYTTSYNILFCPEFEPDEKRD